MEDKSDWTKSSLSKSPLSWVGVHFLCCRKNCDQKHRGINWNGKKIGDIFWKLIPITNDNKTIKSNFPWFASKNILLKNHSMWCGHKFYIPKWMSLNAQYCGESKKKRMFFKNHVNYWYSKKWHSSCDCVVSSVGAFIFSALVSLTYSMKKEKERNAYSIYI